MATALAAATAPKLFDNLKPNKDSNIWQILIFSFLVLIVISIITISLLSYLGIIDWFGDDAKTVININELYVIK
jgi:hypothetical protein